MNTAITKHFDLWLLSICLLPFYTFIVYLLKCIIQKFTDKITNIIFISADTLCIVSVSYLTVINNAYSVEEGWAIYPPLSALNYKIESSHFITGTFNLILIQFVLLLLLVYGTFKTVKTSHSNQ